MLSCILSPPRKSSKPTTNSPPRTAPQLDAAGVFGVNVVGSPGAGKTTLLEALFAHLEGPAAARP